MLGTGYRLSLQIVPYTGGGSLLAGGSEDSSLVECNLSLGTPLAGTEVGQRPYAHEVLAGAGETSEGVVRFGARFTALSRMTVVGFSETSSKSHATFGTFLT